MKLFLFILCLLILQNEAKSQVFFKIETGFVFQSYNKVSIPNAGGTLFDFTTDFELEKPLVPFRLNAGYSCNNGNNFFLLYAPLSVKYIAESAHSNILFQSTLFPKDSLLHGEYKFNSYRATYRRDFLMNDKWTIGAGLTAKIRDASVKLESGDKSSIKTDLGFVPLLNLYISRKFKGWHVSLEGDALAGSRYGRAIDMSLFAYWPICPRITFYSGYRILEGGANVTSVYNFNMTHFFAIGLKGKMIK